LNYLINKGSFSNGNQFWLYSGGLQALQNTMIIAAFPFSIVMALMTISLIKALNKEAKELGIEKLRKQNKKS
jgi:glycine betaine transporter